VVLDTFAGIGYFTLPAVIHGRASHVYCYELNDDALQALRYSLRDNGVHDSGFFFWQEIVESFYLQSPAQHGRCDCVSFDLLPSSEGGWSTAVAALHRERGGWLHNHRNVPVSEVHA
jgi:tRNA wybutosine-synthesizing protein 2